MKEGWFNNDYWALCESQAEAERLTTLYSLAQYLPGYFIVGLKGWDDFILINRESQYFTVPTVPLDQANVTPFNFLAGTLRLEADNRFDKKIKWYVKPIRFGGDPSAKENMAWLSLEQHVEAVKWWNKFYSDTFGKQTKA